MAHPPRMREMVESLQRKGIRRVRTNVGLLESRPHGSTGFGKPFVRYEKSVVAHEASLHITAAVICFRNIGIVKRSSRA